MSLSSVSDIQNTVRRNSEDFSYVKTVAGLINNREFSRGYQEFISGNKTPKTYVWEVLSAIGDDVGSVIYENVLNYIDDVSNVDLCKVKSLRSMLGSFGIEYSVLNNIDLVPLEILNVVDVMSINKKYLLNESVINSNLIDLIKDENEGIYTKGSDLSSLPEEMSGISEIAGYIDDDKYRGFLSSIYTNLIDGVVHQPYGASDLAPIYETYGKTLSKDKFVESDINDDESYKLKIRSNIDPSFNESTIVDNINKGKDFLENYSGVEKTLIEMEIDKRAKPHDSRYNDTKYAYYKEKKVEEYFTFLKTKFFNSNEESKTSAYSIDSSYFEVNQDNQLCMLQYDNASGKYSLTTDDSIPSSYISYDRVLRTVVEELVDITIYISKLREEVKLQLQKSHMKGTFNLLSYVINEYLLEFAKSNKIIKNNAEAIAIIRKRIKSDTKIIEYYDTTEYFNISTDTTKYALNKKLVKDRYWEDNEESTNSNSGFAFAKSEIENFYNNVLNTKNKTSDLMKFLNTIYESGANRSYISDQSGEKVISTKEGLSSDSENLFDRFSGNDEIGTLPQMNHKNKTHSSYQVHPYLFNFIEAANYNYPVINSFYNDLNEDLEDSQVLANIGKYIGKYGEMINIALENQYDYSGYKTRYESSTHEASTGAKIKKYGVIDYDGAFYPKAVEEFILSSENHDQFVELLSSLSERTGDFYRNYYEHLNLSKKEMSHICEQLSAYRDDIVEKASSKLYKRDVWDIYKYGRDAYDNMYILYKKYNKDNEEFKVKRNTRGELWIRLKDHPIAFPAIAGKDPQIDTRVDYYNNLFDNIINGKILSSSDSCSYFYDMEFDTTKQFMFMQYFPVHTLCDKIPTLSSLSSAYDTYQNSSTIACKITQEYDREAGYNRLQLNSNRESKIDGYDNRNMMFLSSDGETILGNPGTAFLGYFKNGNQTGLTYVNKVLSVDDEGNPTYSIPDENNLEASFVIFSKLNSVKEYTGKKIPTELRYCKFENADIQFGYHEDKLTFVFPVSVPQIDDYQNYAGKAAKVYDPTLSSYGHVDYNSASEGDPIYDNSKIEMNSFDTMESFVGVMDTYLEGQLLKPYGSVKLYNLNGDPSYIPTYPGQNGKTDISKSSTYQKKYQDTQYMQFELLGKSKNIDNAINLVVPDADPGVSDTIEETLRKMKEKIYGRVFEDYNDTDKSLRMITNNTLYSTSSDEDIVWEYCDLSNDDYLTERYLSSLELVMYNNETAGKNPFFMGKIQDLSGEEFIDLSYMIEEESSEVPAPGSDNIYIAGTYDFYSHQYNKSDYNTILGIDGIKARFLNGILTIKLHKKENRKMFVPYKTINCVFLNRDDIRMFEKYHILDQYACIEGEISGDIDGRKFRDIYLSAEYLSNYNALSDITYFSGRDNLTFKYDENPIFKKGDLMYYYPGANVVFPKKLNEQYTGSLLDFSKNSDLFDEENLFIVKCDNESIISSFGKVNIPLMYSDTQAIRVIEDFLSNDFQPDYDASDARLIEFSKLYESEQADWEKIEEFELSTTLNPYDFSYETDRLWNECKISPMKVEECPISETSEVIKFDPSTLKDQLKKLSKFMNIYINYRKNSNQSITLFFNYINYLNTPFLKIVDSSVKIDTIERTYLKLDPGQDGKLDIMIQLKYYYDERKLYGYKNIKLMTYHIWNISDDKPKFLIYKESQI